MANPIDAGKLAEAAADALKVENQFLSGVTANIEGAKSRHLRGTMWQTVDRDESDALRAKMAKQRLYDRDLLKRMPKNRRVNVNGYERYLLFWKRQTGSAIGSVMTRFDDLLEADGESKPVSPRIPRCGASSGCALRADLPKKPEMPATNIRISMWCWLNPCPVVGGG